MAGMNTGLEGMRRKHDTARFVKNVLPNGVTIWNQESAIHVDEAIEIMGFLPNVGSQLDPQHKPGLAHFFEHMPFRGTKNSDHEDAHTADNLTADEIFRVRDYLIETEPLTIEIRAR